MKKTFVISVAAICGMMTLCSCRGDVMNDYEQEAGATSLLHVFTRSGDGPTVDENVPTPVSLYVFNASGRCVKILPDVTQNALVAVQGGTYGVYALAGADAAHYDLPSEDDASTTSVISLKAEKTQGDLMASHESVTVADAAEKNLTLTLTRVVSGIKQITIKKVPEAVTAVSVSVDPLYQAFRLDGTYSGTGGSCSVALTEEADGTTWSYSEESGSVFLMPSDGMPTITVSFTSADGTTRYSYTAAKQLEANHKLTIDATYTEQAKLNVTGTITGSEWDDDTAITFEFDETSASGESSGGETGGETGGNTSGSEQGGSGSDTPQTVTLPNVGDLYKSTYYVLKVDNTNNEILVFSPKEVTMGIDPKKVSASEALESLNESLRSWEENPIGTWRVPSYSDMSLIVNQKAKIVSAYSGYATDSKKMYCLNEKGELSYTLQQNTSLTVVAFDKSTSDTVLRPVATIKVTSSD